MSECDRFPIETRGACADPYFIWASETHFAYYGNAQWIPLLIELKKAGALDGSAMAFARLVFDMQAREALERGWAAELIVPPFYRDAPARAARPLTIVSVLARRSLIERVRAGQDPAYCMQRFEIGRALLPVQEAP